MKSRAEIAWMARKILQETAARCPLYADKLGQMAIEVSGRMTRRAGQAQYSRNLITLSLPYFADPHNFEHGLFNTVTHEAAHLIVGIADRGSRPHGPQWRLVHRSMGGTGERCHSLELADGFTARRQKTVSMPCCKCGQPIDLKPRRAQTYREGIARGSMGPGTGYGFHHRICPTPRSGV